MADQEAVPNSEPVIFLKAPEKKAFIFVYFLFCSLTLFSYVCFIDFSHDLGRKTF